MQQYRQQGSLLWTVLTTCFHTPHLSITLHLLALHCGYARGIIFGKIRYAFFVSLILATFASHRNLSYFQVACINQEVARYVIRDVFSHSAKLLPVSICGFLFGTRHDQQCQSTTRSITDKHHDLRMRETWLSVSSVEIITTSLIPNSCDILQGHFTCQRITRKCCS